MRRRPVLKTLLAVLLAPGAALYARHVLRDGWVLRAEDREDRS